MNKILSKLLKLCKVALIGVLIVLALFVAGALIMRFDTGRGLHTYASFGDGRFEILLDGDVGTRSLMDLEPPSSKTLAGIVERYYEDGDYVYVTGYCIEGGVDVNHPDLPYPASILGSKRIYYDLVEAIPRYSILNFKTAEMQLYRTLDEVPEEQRQYFTKNLNWWCDLMRTCYEVK